MIASDVFSGSVMKNKKS